MSITAPFGADVAQLVTTTHAQDVTITLRPPVGDPIPLDLLSGSLTFAATQAPRVTLDVVVRAASTQDGLDLVDPRTGSRLEVAAGYVFPSGRYDSHQVADLLLTYRNSTRPSDALDLRGTSSEQRVIERGADALLTGPAGVPSGLAIRDLIVNRYPPAVVTVHTNGPNVAAAWTLDPGAAPWQLVEELADAAGLEAFDDGLGTIHVGAQTRLGEPSARLFVGEAGTVEASRSDINRDQFANGVALVHRWTPSGGAEQTVTGRAFVTSGPFTWAGAAGRALYVEVRSTEITQGAADAAAAQVLYRRVAAGRGVSVDAVAAWWLRPGMTVDVLLPLGSAMRQLVTTVTYDLVAGRMTVTTREPDPTATMSPTPPGG